VNAQEQQVVTCIPRLRRYARALLKDAEMAEDLVQETLVRALGKLHLWRRGSDMRAWLFTIMHNQHVNEGLRAQKRPTAFSLEDEGVPEPRSSGYADQQAHLGDLETGLQQLPEEQRVVLLLVSLEGLTYQETAKVLGIKQGTVMSRLHRARERMREWITQTTDTKVATIRGVK
jgi:RNA polymerase sigma-70 factor, ECF subfamily